MVNPELRAAFQAKVRSVYVPDGPWDRLSAMAKGAGLSVSALITSTIDLGHAERALEDLKLLAGARRVPEHARASVEKLQAAA